MPRLLFNPFSGTFDYVLRPGEGQVTGETPSGDIDGVNTEFTTAGKFQPGSEKVYYNGDRLRSGVGNDYVTSEGGGFGSGFDTIVLAFAPKAAPGNPDVLLIDYTEA